MFATMLTFYLCVFVFSNKLKILDFVVQMPVFVHFKCLFFIGMFVAMVSALM